VRLPGLCARKLVGSLFHRPPASTTIMRDAESAAAPAPSPTIAVRSESAGVPPLVDCAWLEDERKTSAATDHRSFERCVRIPIFSAAHRDL
jgi:hypothetical protein